MTSDRSIQSKVLVAGASGGMGRAVSRLLAKRGFSLALLGRDAAKVNDIQTDCLDEGTEAHSIICDISQSDSIRKAVRESIEKLGGLNYLINCAGISKRGLLHESDLADAEMILNSNLKAHLYLARYALEEINKQPGGAVIKIGSFNHAYSGANTYTAANLGAEGLAAVMFEDVREYGTRVCTIKPGWVNTPLVKADNIDKNLMIQPDDIAMSVLFMIELPQTACVTEMTILPQRSPYI